MKPTQRNSPTPETKPETGEPARSTASAIHRHVSVGWWTLLVFLTGGLVLEGLHGFKVGAYLNVSNETRRLMWTLAHAHGTLLGLVNLGFAFTLGRLQTWPAQTRDMASAALLGATVLMPGGFFLGGLFTYSGDPGLGILLLPLGGVCLFVAVLLTALAVKKTPF